MVETYKHRVIKEGLEKGLSVKRISDETKLSISAIMSEIDKDIDLKILLYL